MRKLLALLLALPLLAAAHADDDGWALTARIAGPTAPYAPATAANGRLGAVIGRPPLRLERVIVGNAYTRGGRHGVSCILEGIRPIDMTLRIDGQEVGPAEEIEQTIDLRRAVHTTRFRSEAAVVTCRYRALRHLPCALMAELEIEALRDARFEVTNRHRIPAFLADTLCEVRTVWCEEGGRRVQRSEGSYDDGSERIAAASLFLDGPESRAEGDRTSVTLRRGERTSFALVATLCTTADVADPWNEAERMAIYAAREGREGLVATHERAWDELWRSDILIEGDPQAQRDVRFALYNLYSSLRAGSRRSIAPMGLTAQGYNGHIFWDAETWMLPPLLLLQPGLARSMIDYRTDRLDAARRRAQAHGYRGAMFPWESDDPGEESTPTFALTGPLEHHITADVAIAAWQYYCVTGDRAWLSREGYPLLRDAARFWCDRTTENADGSRSIRNVVGADEYAIGVTDNAFTNGAARRALEYADRAARLCGQRPDPEWRTTAAALRILRFPDGTVREHAAYEGERIKQADANLLGYPLALVTGREALLRDLAYYEGRIDPAHGPAMSYSVFAIQYARLGMAEKAWAMFRRAYLPNLRPPFGVFAETASSDNPYFVTGAGGMLQAVLFGFGGLEITPRGIVQRRAVLPPHWKRLTIRLPERTFVREQRHPASE